MLCHVVAVKQLPVHHYCTGCVFWSLGAIEFIKSHFENRVLIKPVLGGMASVAHCITGPGCSKLTTSLVNETLKFQTLISQICQYFVGKM